jgi:hypothetical protein
MNTTQKNPLDTSVSSPNHELRFDIVTVVTKMSKREAASLVRFLTDAIAESQDGLLDVRIDLRNEFGGAQALISVGNNTLFGSSAVITDSRIVNREAK